MNSTLLLKRVGLRATPRRVSLLGGLQKAHGPLSAEDLHREVRGLDLVTVYRNLQEFVKAGIAAEVRFKDGIVRYEIAHAHHHHLVCTDCGLVEEIAACDMAPLEKRVLQGSRRFTRISEHALEFFGLCKKCA